MAPPQYCKMPKGWRWQRTQTPAWQHQSNSIEVRRVGAETHRSLHLLHRTDLGGARAVRPRSMWHSGRSRMNEGDQMQSRAVGQRSLLPGTRPIPAVKLRWRHIRMASPLIAGFERSASRAPATRVNERYGSMFRSDLRTRPDSQDTRDSLFRVRPGKSPDRPNGGPLSPLLSASSADR